MKHLGGRTVAFAFEGIDHVQLAAPEGCESEARAFYGGVLGWPEMPKPESLRHRGGVWFRCGAHEVHIGVQRDFVPARKAHPAFRVRNPEALRERLVASGVRPADDDARTDAGIRRFYVSDPFGNRIEFLEWREADRQP
jgi:catechol 2,3-dioxygenase-like lactoylglutathione lyase family enzyme